MLKISKSFLVVAIVLLLTLVPFSVNAVDLNSVFSRQSELEDAIQKEIDDKNLDFYMFAATDILNANSKIIAMGRKANTVEKAFGVNLENNTAILNNVVSRKKQMLPNILNNLD